MDEDKLSRRAVLKSGAALGSLVMFGASACNKQAAPLTCTDTTGLSATDVTVRTSLAYVDTSVEPGKTCSNCQQFVANANAAACGTCKVVKGPINPKGYCKSYVVKPA